MTRFAIIAAVAFVLTAGAAWAQDDQVERGRVIAETWCSACHVIGDDPQPQALAGAPSFPQLAQDPSIDDAALAYALLQPHPVMPSFPVTREDIAAIAAYLRSLRTVERDARLQGTTMIAGHSHETPDVSDEAVAEGKALAEVFCAKCHAVEGEGPSPVADAPPFATLSQNYPVSHLEEALAEGIVVNHPEVQMPEFVMEPKQIDAFIAFLETIQIKR